MRVFGGASFSLAKTSNSCAQSGSEFHHYRGITAISAVIQDASDFFVAPNPSSTNEAVTNAIFEMMAASVVFDDELLSGITEVAGILG